MSSKTNLILPLAALLIGCSTETAHRPTEVQTSTGVPPAERAVVSAPPGKPSASSPMAVATPSASGPAVAPSAAVAPPPSGPRHPKSQVLLDVVPLLPTITYADAKAKGWPDGYLPNLVREVKTVHFQGKDETWTLRWKELPEPYCFDDTELLTGPCLEFARGERGDLELIRERPGEKVEVTGLSGWGSEDGSSIAAPRFAKGTRLTRASLSAAHSIPLLEVADYTGDGESAEFVLPGLYLAFGQVTHNLIGLTGDRPYLHAIGTVAHPDEPLLFLGEGDRFAPLLGSSVGRGRPVEIVSQQCGDHGNDVELAARLQRTSEGLVGTYQVFDCSGPHGRGVVKESGTL